MAMRLDWSRWVQIPSARERSCRESLSQAAQQPSCHNETMVCMSPAAQQELLRQKTRRVPGAPAWRLQKPFKQSWKRWKLEVTHWR